MVKPNLWIDRKPSPATAVASQQASYGSGSQAGTWATGRVLEVLDDGLVRVELPADEPVTKAASPAARPPTPRGPHIPSPHPPPRPA